MKASGAKRERNDVTVMEPFPACLPACLSVCLSARTSESINTSQNAQFLLTCSPPFISGENKHGLWVLSRSAFFRASIVFVLAAFQPATLGNVHSVLPGTWRNSLVIMRLPLHCKINGSLQIPSQGVPSQMSGSQEGSGQEGFDVVYKPSRCKLQPLEQCHSLSKASLGTGAVSGKPKGGSLSHPSARSSTLRVCRQLNIGCGRELLITSV